LAKVFIITVLYVICVVLANMTAHIIVDFGITFALGTVLFGATFTLRDMMHDTIGKKKTFYVILVTILINIFLVTLGAFDFRILIASVVAFYVSSVIDTEIYQRFIHKVWHLRVIYSNVVSIPVDTILFTLIAFLFLWDTTTIILVVVGDTIVKYIMSGLIIGGRVYNEN
jgi:uncharacterized PurR-regulated membrane protein YhhQ (DUF165 family)